MKGIVFDIQQYAVHDGPGIRTSVFLKGCPLTCTWCHNPESQQPQPQMAYLKTRCSGCGECEAGCPQNAIRLTGSGIVRDASLCTCCGACTVLCHTGAMEKIGETMSVEEIAAIVLKDRAFYDNSGGGVTVSGGEPTCQKDFLLALLDRLRQEKIHTAIETCGFFGQGMIPPLTDQVDLFLFDIKHVDPVRHRAFTGRSNKIILSNFREILNRLGGDRIVPRVPLIPGFNTEPTFINSLIDYLEEAGYRGAIHLMPYNKMARTKYEKIGMGRQYMNMGDLSPQVLQTIMDKLNASGFEPVCSR